MRQVTQLTAQALKNNKNIKINNTQVKNGVFDLFNNTIAVYNDLERSLMIRDSGYRTVTTKERLNGILQEFGLGAHITQYKKVWYIVRDGEREEWQGFAVFSV